MDNQKLRRLMTVCWHLNLSFWYLFTTFPISFVRRVWRYQRGNQHQYIKEEQKT